MMALGTVIGGSFFLGSAFAVNAAGPSVLICFAAGGVIVNFILLALSEMTVASPEPGSFRSFSAKVFGQGTGFVVGWVYWTGMVLAMSSEAAAISLLIRNWAPGIPIALLGSGVIAAAAFLNLLGTTKLSGIESGLAVIKLLAIVSFIVIALLLIAGLVPGRAATGAGALLSEPFMPSGIRGLSGSMLTVLYTYAGFEIIGLASSEAENPRKTVPKAIRYTVVSLVALYVAYIAALLPLIPTAEVSENVSPIVAALNAHGFAWAGGALNAVLISAIFSTMLAAMFGIGRMMRSLADEGLAPAWLRDRGDIPYKGILASGAAMLASLGAGLLFPRFYLFLISSSGFTILFSYGVIVATQIRFRKKNGCPPDGRCQIWGFPYTSYLTLLFIIASIAGMPFVPGQASGLIAGCAVVVFFSLVYLGVKYTGRGPKLLYGKRAAFSAEISEETAVRLSKNSEEKTGDDRKK